MFEFVLSPETLSVIVAALLSLLFSYVPGFATWYSQLGKNADGTDDNGTLKRVVMLVLLLITVGSIFGLACYGLLAGVVCSQAGFINLFWTFIVCVMANQGLHMVSPRIGLKTKPAPPRGPSLTQLSTTWPDGAENRPGALREDGWPVEDRRSAE